MISTGICRWLFMLISLSTWTKLIDSKEMRIVCYYTNWSVYRPGQAKFSPQNINPYLCTHLVYAFGGFTKENMLKPFDKYQDIEKGGYAKFTGLKTYNKNLKTLIAIGGWNEGSSRFSPMVASPERRKELVKNTIKFLRQNHFDGLDLDWEYPTFRDGGKPRDRDNYAQLVQELREEFDRESEKTGRPRLLLTMAVPAGIEYINKGYDVPKLTRYLDWMNILSYDYHSAFEPAVNHHAPLYSLEEDNEYNYDAELNIDYTIKHYLKLGADPAKLVLGIPTYGRSYTLFNPDAYEIGSPADGPGDMGEATRENGYLAYYEICDYVKNQDWEVDEPNSNVMGPIAFKNNQWVGYDDEKIVKKKAEYVALNNLGGIMFWAIDNDDFRGSCHGKPYPLIEAGKEALLNAYGLTEENLISPPSKPTKLSKTKSRARTTKTSTESSQAASTTRRRRIKQKSDEEITLTNGRKPGETSTYSNLKIVTPAYTTPEPPATPDMGGGFKCEDEGFYPHPKDCKKYYWCLSGAADSGIVAHQFTCPAGLYFNKAADSCDYSQNVLCNKKLQKATTSSTTQKSDVTTPETPSTSQSFISTTRAPPKISAAPSKSTINFRTTTTTTEAYETEYEYEDEEEPNKREESEQDPRVLKELIDLIKKAGGIEELEKQLKLNKEDSTLSSDSTTPSGISKSLYERVLSKTSKNSLSKNSSRNSGGPQGAQGSGNSNQIARGRLQYKTLSRQRPSTDQSIVDSQDELEEENKERGSIRAKSSLEYINIRRPKTGTTTETTEDDGSSRNKILGEIDADTETTSKKNTPHYVNIRRQRPSTTEPSITSSKYSSIRRSTTVSTEPSVDQNDKIRRDSTTESSVVTEKSTSLRYQIIRRGTTTARATIEDETLRTKSTPENAESESLFKTVTLAPSSEQNASTLRYQTISRTTTIPQTSEILNATSTEKDVPTSTAAVLNPEITTLFPDNLNSINSSSSENFITSTYKSTTQSNNSTQISNSPSETETKKKRPILFQPRPFTTTVVSTSTTNPSTTNVNSKVSQSSIKFRVRSTTASNDLQSLSTTEQVTEATRIRSRSRLSSTNGRNLSEEIESKPVRTRKRLLVTTERTVHTNNTSEDVDRKYRPAELADLSSLTAADLNLRGADFVSRNRRRRPTTVRPLDSSNTTDIKTNDQINASSDQSSTTKKIVRGFRSTTAKPIVEGSSTSTPFRTRKIVRKFRPGLNGTDNTVVLSSIQNTTTGQLRRRIPIFRQRENLTTTVTEASKLSTTENSLLKLFKPRSRFEISKNNRNSTNQDETKDESSTEQGTILNDEEGENINLSESNISESSKINAFKFEEKPGRLLKKSKQQVFNKDSNVKSTTEAITRSTTTTSRSDVNRLLRRRKIIRKVETGLNTTSLDTTTSLPITTTSSKEFSTVSPSTKPITNGTNVRRVKILRRIRPTNSLEQKSEEKTEKLRKKNPPKDLSATESISQFTIETTPKPTTERSKIHKVLSRYDYEPNNFRIYKPTTTPFPYSFPSRLDTYTRPSFFEDNDDNDEDDHTNKFEDDDDDHDFNFDEEFGDDDFDDHHTEPFVPKYTIFTTSSFNRMHQFESNTNFDDNDDPDKKNKSVIIAMNSRKESEKILDKDGKEIEVANNKKEIKAGEPGTTELATSSSFESSTIADSTTYVQETTLDNEVEETKRTTVPFTNFKETTVPEFFGSPTTETTTEYRRRSTLIPVKDRPRIGNRRITETPYEFSSTEPSISVTKKNLRTFGRNRKVTIPSLETSESRLNTSPLPVNKFILRYSTSEPNHKESSTKITSNKPVDTGKLKKLPSFKSTFHKETSSTTFKENLEPLNINTEAVKNRNKHLFSKRKMNTPIAHAFTTSSPIPTEATDPNLTTLHHVFAEVDDPDSTTEAMKSSSTGNSSGKLERLIEVNRIVEVQAKEGKVKNPNGTLEVATKVKIVPTVDKIGEISRITLIKIVDGNNETIIKDTDSNEIGSPMESAPGYAAKVIEVPSSIQNVSLKNIQLDVSLDNSSRQDRKFEIFSDSKVANGNTNMISSADKPQIIDGKSQINAITPKPVLGTETSTISLQGLFRTENPNLNPSFTSNDEVLETGRSEFINVRVLDQDKGQHTGQPSTSNFVPVRILPQFEEESTVKAHVVEISPKPEARTIKIVPIRVEMSRHVAKSQPIKQI